MSIYQGQITGSLKVQSSLTGLLYATSGVVSAVALGSANGVATLDSNGRLPISQLSTSAMEIKGDWDASLNSPSLANGTGNMGDVYRCSVAGSVNFGAGSVTFIVGDLVYYTGSIWQIVANSFSLTTSGASGSASLTGRTLNIPTYTLTGLGGVASTRSLTINGTAYDLSADRSWNIPSSPQARTVTTQTATLNQQVFTVSYTSGQIDVYYNGSYLAPSDYTATNGTSVTLAFQCKANDVLVFAAYTNTLTIGGSGVSNYMAKWNSSSLLTSSTILYDTGSLLFVNKSTDNSSGAVLQVNGYITQSTLSAILKADSSGKIIAATSGTDYLAPSALSSYVPYTGASTNLNLGSNSLTTNSIQANSIATPSSSEGLLWYDSTQKAFAYYNDITNNILHIGQEVQLKVYNNTGSTIAKGAPVYITSTSSGFTYPNVALAIANNIVTGNVIGLANQAIPNATAGYVTLSGLITGVNTGTYTVGDVLYLSPYSAGQYMNTVPPTGYISRIGMVSYVSSSNGTIYVNQTYASPSNPITGTGTTNTLPKFTAASTIGNSNITDTGSLITLGSNSYVNGNLGVGVNPASQINIYVSKNITGNAFSRSIFTQGAIQSDVTNTALYFSTNPSTAATAFTLPTLHNYYASGVSLGAGSSVTSQYGFYAESNMTAATNNYGFYGSLAAATNTWNLYMSGTANNYMAGSLGIGATSLTSYSLRVSKNITGGTISYGIQSDGIIQSDVGNQPHYYSTNAQTAAATFTISTLLHYRAVQGTFGAGSTVTSQVGFWVDNTLIGATNNYGFYGNIAASGSSRWNLFMNGTAPNYLAGTLNIGSTGLGGTNFSLNKTITGGWLSSATYGVNMYSTGAVQSDVTAYAYYFVTRPSTAAAAFTLSNLVSYAADVVTIGSTSAVSNLYGFLVNSNHIGATNNYGFFGNLAAATNTWNLCMSGTASNYMAGSLGIGSTSLTGYGLRNTKNITGATLSIAYSADGTVQSDVTTTAQGYRSVIATQATAFTLTNLQHFVAGQGTFGAGSTVTNQYAFYADSGLISATNNYGFYSAITVSGTSRWALYMAGTAPNYMAGQTGVGTTTLGTYIFNVGGSVTTLVNFNSTNASGFYTTYSASGVEKAYIGLGANTISGLAVSDFGIVGSANVVIASGSGGTETMRIDSTKRIGIGTGSSINASAKVQIDSTTSGFLPPRGTNAQRTAITSPAVGLIFYCTDSVEGLYIYTSSGWKSLTMV